MVSNYIHSTVIILCVLNALLHLSGMYFLICLRHSTMNGSQRMFLLHLSLSESFLTFIEMGKRIIYIITNSEHTMVTEYMTVVQFSSAAMVYLLIMIYLTVDRFFELYLNIRYPVYWSEKKTKRLLMVTWIVFVVLMLILSLLYNYQSIDYKWLFYIYIWPITEAVFLAIAFLTYGYIIRKLYISNKSTNAFRASIHRLSINNNNAIAAPVPSQPNLTKSAFYLPTLLILTFVLLQVVPDLTILFVVLSGNVVPDHVLTGVFMTYMVSILLDAIIYIFLSPYVNEMFIKKLIRMNVMTRPNISEPAIQYRIPNNL